jgi:acetoin utilization deacetylase AcuC-like enzyme
VRRFSADPKCESEAGIGPGDVEHAYHPGGGLHHAMRARASGFRIYNAAPGTLARIEALLAAG